MSATFGRLNGSQLDLQPGLNVICAPNESGKSTWCRFLQNMLYGVPTKERGLLADKNRYAPWSGSPMQGRLLLRNGDVRYTLLRETRRATAPMSDAHLTYTGTADPVPGIPAAEAGQYLLGIPREVFLRSAFIGQNALAVDQDAELERRIAALISTGEEDTSYSESYERLKKQLNARRANRSTGQIPALEQEIAQLEDALARQESLREQFDAAQLRLQDAQHQLEELQQQDAQWQQLERQAARRQYEEAQAALSTAQLRRPTGRGDTLPAGGTSYRSDPVHRRPAAGHGASGPAAPAGRRGHGPLHGTPPLSRRRAAAAKPPVRPDGPARTIEAAPACGTSSAGRGRSLRAAASACVCAHSLWRSRCRRSAIRYSIPPSSRQGEAAGRRPAEHLTVADRRVSPSTDGGAGGHSQRRCRRSRRRSHGS